MNPLEQYYKLTKKAPVLTAGGQALAAGVAGKYAAKFALPMVLAPLLSRLPGGMGNQAIRKLTPQKVNRLSNIVGALIGGGEFARAALARDKGLHSEVFGSEDKLRKGSYSPPGVNPLTGELAPIQKTSLDNSWDFGEAGFNREIIPTKNMISSINKDKYMNPFQKLKTNTILYNADQDKKGLVSGRKVAQAAIRAGLGFMPGYALGKTLTSLSGLPTEVVDRMAYLGGIGGALLNTGVLEI